MRRLAGDGPPLAPELLVAAGFVLSGWIGGGALRVLSLCWLVAFGVAAMLVDMAVQRLPEVLTWLGAAGVFVFSYGQAARADAFATGFRMLFAALALAGFFLALALLFDVGLGDAQFAVSLGAALGYVSWSAVVDGVAATFLIAGLYTAFLLIARRRRSSTSVPLGPALLAGTFLTLALTR